MHQYIFWTYYAVLSRYSSSVTMFKYLNGEMCEFVCKYTYVREFANITNSRTRSSCFSGTNTEIFYLITIHFSVCGNVAGTCVFKLKACLWIDIACNKCRRIAAYDPWWCPLHQPEFVMCFDFFFQFLFKKLYFPQFLFEKFDFFQFLFEKIFYWENFNFYWKKMHFSLRKLQFSLWKFQFSSKKFHFSLRKFQFLFNFNFWFNFCFVKDFLNNFSLSATFCLNSKLKWIWIRNK